jgi:hypothetical protein
MNWTAADLLEKILEFNAMTPNQNEWSEKTLDYNRPPAPSRSPAPDGIIQTKLT